MINKRIKIFFGIPALVIHELSHIIAIILVGAKGQGVDVNAEIDDFKVTVHYQTDKNWKKNIISLAPAIGFIMWSLAIFLTSGVTFLILLSYTFIYIRIFLPSDVDIKTYRTPLEYDIDEIPVYEKSEF